MSRTPGLTSLEWCARLADNAKAALDAQPDYELAPSRRYVQYWPLGVKYTDGRRRNGRAPRSWRRGAE